MSTASILLSVLCGDFRVSRIRLHGKAGRESEMTTSARGMPREANWQSANRSNAFILISWNSTFVYRCLIAFIGLIITPFVSGAQGAQPTRSESNDPYTLRLNANLVILSATVLDRHNVPVSGLSRDDFKVYEDGVLQQIKDFSQDDIPVTAGILVDNSGSMGPKRNDVIAAAMAFAFSSNPQDQLFVVNFSDHVSLGLPAEEPFTGSQGQLRQALSGIRAIGQTSLYDGIAAALDHLRLGSRDKKVLVLISDGGDNASKLTLAKTIDLAKRSTAIIYTIGIFDDGDGDQNPAVLRRFAKETGGEAYFPQSSNQISSICREIARDIRMQYTLTYIPGNTLQDSKYRTIEVTASAPGRRRLSVRTRAGYFSSRKVPDIVGRDTRP